MKKVKFFMGILMLLIATWAFSEPETPKESSGKTFSKIGDCDAGKKCGKSGVCIDTKCWKPVVITCKTYEKGKIPVDSEKIAPSKKCNPMLKDKDIVY